MSLQSVLPYYARAQAEGWALGAFNANTLEQIQAIVAAAEAEHAPVLIQLSHHALEYAGLGNPALGLRYLGGAAITAANSVSVPVSIHLDHANEVETLQALALGFTSVMFDGGELPYEENVAATRRVVLAAHALGAAVEAELGEVPRADAEGQSDRPELTDPSEAAAFSADTGVDALAISLGSVHAIQEKNVRLDLDRLRQIRAVVATPLVLHGSSGVSDADIAAGIGLGLCKVNVATQMNQSFSLAAREALAAAPRLVDPRKYLGPARAAMVEAVRERLRFVGAAGKA